MSTTQDETAAAVYAAKQTDPAGNARRWMIESKTATLCTLTANMRKDPRATLFVRQPGMDGIRRRAGESR